MGAFFIVDALMPFMSTQDVLKRCPTNTEVPYVIVHLDDAKPRRLHYLMFPELLSHIMPSEPARNTPQQRPLGPNRPCILNSSIVSSH